MFYKQKKTDCRLTVCFKLLFINITELQELDFAVFL